MMPPDPHLAVVVRQNAITSRLLGVDFVPVYRSGRSAPAFSADTRVAAPEASPMTTETADAAGTMEVEMKPVVPTPRVTPAAPRSRGVATAARPAPVAPAAEAAGSLVPPLAMQDFSADPRRTAALAALEQIRRRYDADAPHQHFCTDHHCIVFGEGDPCARLMFIGEAPGADEDRTGRPFVGRAGQLLTKMINAMGLQRESVYITNVLKTRPPNNATPTLDEARLCAPYLYEQIGAIRPEAIVTLGLPATRLLLGTDQSMSSLRGRWSEFVWNDVRVPVMPTYHPAFLLRSYTKENREKVWSDLQLAMQRLGVQSVKAMPSE
jgi:DNA polymerase